MKNLIAAALVAAFVIILTSCNSKTNQHLAYPQTKKVDTVDEYFGTKIADPYRWLEDDNSAETAEWVKAENNVTDDYLGKIPFRSKIKKRLTQIWNYEKVTTPWKKGKYYFFSKNDGVQNQSLLYVQEGLNGTPRVLIDPNKLDERGTTSLANTSVRKDGKYMAYTLSKAGSDWQQILVMEIESGKMLSDTINWVKFTGIDWKGDGFYYTAYEKPKDGHIYSKKNQSSKVYFHRLGQRQELDEMVHEDKEHPHWNSGIGVSDDGKIASLYTSESTSGNALRLKNLTSKSDWKAVDTSFKYDYHIVEYLDDNSVLLQTNNAAPNNRVIKVDVANPSPENWKEIIPQSKDVLQGTMVCGGKIVAGYMHDVTSKVLLFSLDGKAEGEIKLPAPGVASFSGDKDDSVAFISFTNFLTPASVYKYNMLTGAQEVFFQPKVDFKGDDYETKQVFYKSKDGTQIGRASCR